MADDAAETAPVERDETPAERADRNFDDLLQELRVSETGVQVLFSVLLTVPFSQRFRETTPFQKDVYFLALLLAATSSVLLIAPVTYHRLLFARGEKPWVVKVSSRLALSGVALLWLAITAVLLLVSDVLFQSWESVLVATVFGSLTAALWFGPPLAHRLKR